ncbi:MAG: DUF2203 domain-containing protein [Thermoleophilaceae bacterium]
MIHERHFSVAQANAVLPWVRERLERLRDAQGRLGDEEAREALAEAGPGNGGGDPGRVVSEAFLELRNELIAFQEAGVILRELERGLVDFPSLMDGREVYLCWVDGEDEVGYWHEIEAGYAGRQPL